VSLTWEDEAPTSLHENRIGGPQNFRLPVQNDFCNSIGHKRPHALQHERKQKDRLARRSNQNLIRVFGLGGDCSRLPLPAPAKQTQRAKATSKEG